MPAAPAGFSLGAVRPEDAIAAFQQRGLLRPSFRWQDVWQAEHARAFAVAGVMRMDVLQLLRDEVGAALEAGTSMEVFTRRVREQLVARGFWGDVEVTDPATGELRTTRFNRARLELIFDVNMRQSHAAGRWARAMRSRMPYLVYRTMRDERVRASHRPWDNVVLPKDHPWWDTHYPPNGWRCRCTAYALDDKGLERLRAAGVPVKTEPPATTWVEFVNRSTGMTERVPRGVDPGFAYNPGKVHVELGTELLARRLGAVRPVPGAGRQAAGGSGGDALATTRAVVQRMRRERTFAEFLRQPPDTAAGLPVAAVPALPGEPPIASVSGQALRRQAAAALYPPPLPVTAAGWALAQAILDRGQRVELADDATLWWWLRDGRAGQPQRVLVLEMQRSALVWWVRTLATLALDEAARLYPRLQPLLPAQRAGEGGA